MYAADSPHHAEHAGPPSGLGRWLLTTNHKDIGSLYMWFAGIMFLIAGSMALVIRAELFQPGLQVVNPDFFNQMTTLHGLIMVFGVIMPAWAGFANWQIPLMIGAPDMALPRLNNWSFWILPPAAVMLVLPFVLGLFGVGTGAVDAGWTLNAPLSVQTGWGMDFAIFAIHMLGMSSILASINVVVTVEREQARRTRANWQQVKKALRRKADEKQ